MPDNSIYHNSKAKKHQFFLKYSTFHHQQKMGFTKYIKLTCPSCGYRERKVRFQFSLLDTIKVLLTPLSDDEVRCPKCGARLKRKVIC